MDVCFHQALEFGSFSFSNENSQHTPEVFKQEECLVGLSLDGSLFTKALVLFTPFS